MFPGFSRQNRPWLAIFLGFSLAFSTFLPAEEPSVYAHETDTRLPYAPQDPDEVFEAFFEMNTSVAGKRFDAMLSELERFLVQNPAPAGELRRGVGQFLDRHWRGRPNPYLPPPAFLSTLRPEILRPVLRRTTPSEVRRLRDALADSGDYRLLSAVAEADIHHSHQKLKRSWLGGGLFGRWRLRESIEFAQAQGFENASRYPEVKMQLCDGFLRALLAH